MKKLLLTSIAALFLATGTAHAADREKWEVYWRNCEIRIWFSPEQLQAATRWEVDNEGKEIGWEAIAIEAEEIPNLLKLTIAGADAAKALPFRRNLRRWIITSLAHQ
jgi:hypothetical protein